MLQTRLDVAVYVHSLQRVSKKPTGVSLRRLNRIVRYVQKNSRSLEYRPLPPPVILIGIGDSAYQAGPEDDTNSPLVMRGYAIALAHGPMAINASMGSVRASPVGGQQYKLQLLEYVAGKQTHVCRGVWSAELYNQCDMLGMCSVMAGFLEEIRHGVQSADALRQRQVEGRFATEIELHTDSKSIWTYLQADHLKMPAERGTFHHLAYCREALLSGLVKRWIWNDTRDMVVDGLTKGLADRTALHRLMSGIWELKYEQETLHSTTLAARRSSARIA
jgi:hypothetical protein